MPRFRGPSVQQVARCPASPPAPPSPGVPGVCRGVVAPPCLVPGPAPAGGDSLCLLGPGTLTGQTGFSLPLCPFQEQDAALG